MMKLTVLLSLKDRKEDFANIWAINRLINVSTYSKMVEVKFFKGFLPQILLDPFLNKLTQI